MLAINKCAVCKKRIAMKKRCCSIKCRNVLAGRESASKRSATFVAVCKKCAKYYYVNRSKLKRTKYCSRACLARATIAKKKVI